MTPSYSKKICLLGDFAVGKTSLVRRFVDNQFSDDYLSTIGVKISRKKVELTRESGERLAVQLVLWDVEGKNGFSDTPSSYLQGASGAIITGDLTRSETIAHINDHVNSFLAVNPRSFIVAAYNKSDLLDKCEVPLPASFEGHERVIYTRRTSAKNGDGVQDLFTLLTRKLIEG